MALITVERLDHLGLIAEIIKDIGLIDMINARLVPDRQEDITPGEAVAGMILNGLGFANRPLSLTRDCLTERNRGLTLLAARLGLDGSLCICNIWHYWKCGAERSPKKCQPVNGPTDIF